LGFARNKKDYVEKTKKFYFPCTHPDNSEFKRDISNIKVIFDASNKNTMTVNTFKVGPCKDDEDYIEATI